MSTVDSIRAGSYVKANEGCLIIRASSLFNNIQSYYYLKKSLISGKVDFDYNRGYLELFTLAGLKPGKVEINTKVIIIGSYELYQLLYNYDEEYKNIFKLKGEYKKILDNTDYTRAILSREIERAVKSNGTMEIEEEGIKEIAKYLSRKSGNRNKIMFDYDEITNAIIMADRRANEFRSDRICGSHIEEVLYKKDILEEEYLKMYTEKKLLMDLKGEKIGQINALSIIDAGYVSFGKPVRITCTCWKGEGKIIDAQREASLSGKIHTKGISTLKGLINNLNGGYRELPVDFNLSFEQTYGVIDGDSASAAEALVILSALCRIPVKQNIAITGSVNQFGEMQAIGGVNEKIEGFYRVCRAMDTVQEKGVIIPESNAEELVLCREVEEAVEKGEFNIYTVTHIKDAVKIIFDLKEEEDIIDDLAAYINMKCHNYEDKKEK